MASTTRTARLAVEGGSPVRERLLPYGRHWLDKSDVQAVVSVLQGDWLSTGPTVAAFEREFAAWNEVSDAVAVSSGTAALHAAAFVAGFRPGDEVITTPLTFVATANCILYVGATLVFADIDPQTLCIDPQEVERRITPRTRGIIVMHYAGQACDMDPIIEIAERRGLVVIEDACHAMGARYKGRQTGTIGHLACYSFHPVKHITTGEGGMVVTRNKEWGNKLRAFRNHGFRVEGVQPQEAEAWVRDMVYPGQNYRLTDFQSALGISQLKKVNGWISQRQAIAARYHQAFAEMEAVATVCVRSDVEPAWHLYPILLRLERLSVGRAEILRAMRAENIAVNVHYQPVHVHSYYRERFGFRRGDYPRAEMAYEQLLTLPLFPQMTSQDVDDVITALKKVTSHYLLCRQTTITPRGVE